jgi:hypothetical protein
LVLDVPMSTPSSRLIRAPLRLGRALKTPGVTVPADFA